MKVFDNKENRKIHLGCGLNSPNGWVNVDGSWNAWLAKYRKLKWLLQKINIVQNRQLIIPWSTEIIIHDVRRRLPFPDGSAKAVYASHLLEHLYLVEEEFLLRECFRILCPGGILRIVVPDLKAIIEEYMGKKDLKMEENTRMLRPAEKLNRRLLLRNISPPKGNIIFGLYNLLKDFHTHKYMHDVDSLKGLFERLGFKEVAEMDYHQSRIEDIVNIEKEECIANGAGICVEGVKIE
jgi:SAM-dependent methyltransferase